MLLVLATFLGCSGNSEACIAAKESARVAWGEVAVRYGLALAVAEDAKKEPAGRLAALERRRDAPAEGKAVLTAEIAAAQAKIDVLQPRAETAQTIAGAFAGQKAADALALAKSMAPKLEGEDVRAALTKSEAAAATCGGVE